MKNSLRSKFEHLVSILMGTQKEFAEIKFWRKQVDNYIQWYKGELPVLFGTPSPVNKVQAYSIREAALLTFFRDHQVIKYLKDLHLDENALRGMKVLDIGSGPFPSGLCYKDAEIYCLDPLMGKYMEAGYPMHCYDSRARFVQSMAEDMPFNDGFFDAVISVNAIDHVNDFAQTAKEIKRVLKPGGRFRMHVHYHPKTTAEPIELNDEVFLQHYSWVSNMKRIHESAQKTGTTLTDPREKYVVWGN
jgi:ubiquinone/menaquinone biosynthesis C-methylase UbiE